MDAGQSDREKTARSNPVFIRHRVNRIKDLGGVDPSHGVEIDLRTGDGKGSIILAHDPWETGDPFDAWLDRFTALGLKGPIVLNVKVDGVEPVVMRLLRDHGLEDWFFLDSQMPTLVHWTVRQGEERFAVRLSRYEPPELLDAFRGRVRWLWVDCFHGLPVSRELLQRAGEGFKVCLVSPELQGAPVHAIAAFGDLLPLAQAICTRHPEAW
ncbi:MAG: hypothetical protein GXP54_06090 [Deltaproteobacteria bacterium]|nr:hypothetical protein [Deltaproteobacteria bacterium]